MKQEDTKQQGAQQGGTTTTTTTAQRSTGRGFASMDPERQRQIASQGGKAAHQKGTAHQFTSEEARRAGSKGGKAAHERGTAHQFNSAEARAAGRKGGEASGASRSQAANAAKSSGTGSSGNTVQQHLPEQAEEDETQGS